MPFPGNDTFFCLERERQLYQQELRLSPLPIQVLSTDMNLDISSVYSLSLAVNVRPI